MNNQFYDLTDAFLALKDIDDEDVSSMLKQSSRRVVEGKEFSINTGSQELEDAKKFLEETDAETQLEVIDVDADSVEHLKKNTEYVGQGILRCNRCMANRFVDMDTLVAAESDPDLYNVEEECPHCHDAGAGYELIGQVGKVVKDEPIEQATEQETAEPVAVDSEEEAKVDNDEHDVDAVGFDNDVEQEPAPEAAESPADTEPEEEFPMIDFQADDEESDGMETNTSEDDETDLELPDLGDVKDSDDVKEDDTDDDVKESFAGKYLKEEIGNEYSEDAWMMNRVISSMNNEDAYYGSWLYTWPDGEDKEQCFYDFGNESDHADLRDTFIRIYKKYHADGLYDATDDVVKYAHDLDSQLHLAPINNIPPYTPQLTESYACEAVGDVLNMFANPDHFERVKICDSSNDSCRDIYDGAYGDIPMNVVGSKCKSFNVGGDYLTCNIDTEDKEPVNRLSTALNMFDDASDKIMLWDAASGDDVFTGTKDDALRQFGGSKFISFETPAVIKFTICDPAIVAEHEIEEQDTDVDHLVKKIIKANSLSEHKINNSNTNEFWIRESIISGDDVDIIYERFVKDICDKETVREFKNITGYTNAIEEAYEAGLNESAASKTDLAPNNASECVKDYLKLLANNQTISSNNLRALSTAADESYDELERIANNLNREIPQSVIDDVLALAKEHMEEAYDPNLAAENEYADIEATDAYNEMGDCPKCGANGSFNLKHDFCIECGYSEYEDNLPGKEDVKTEALDDTAKGTSLAKATDGTQLMSDGNGKAGGKYWVADRNGKKVKDIDTASTSNNNYEKEKNDVINKFKSGEYKKNEAFKSFKSRKELSEAIEQCKNNNQAYSVRRSVTEGFRYDLLLAEDVADDQALIPAAETDITAPDEADYSPVEMNVMNEINRISLDIADAVKKYYNIDADPAIVVADILQDLGLISGSIKPEELADTPINSITKQMYKSYENFYDAVEYLLYAFTGEDIHVTPEQKLQQALKTLFSPSFSKQAIDRGIGSTRFLSAVSHGMVPYLPSTARPALPEALTESEEDDQDFIDYDTDVCPKCGRYSYSYNAGGCQRCNYGFADDEELEEVEEIDIDIEKFDEDMNNYFNEAYEETVLYTTGKGQVNSDGSIMLEGYLDNGEDVKDVTFTLTPENNNTVYESVNDYKADLTYTVTNNLTEEVFQFAFKDELAE